MKGGPPRLWLSEAAIIASLMMLPLLFWWRLWAWDPADRAVIPEGDFTSQYYPLQFFAAQELAAGRLPAWDAYINSGQPGLADIQTGFFYPLNLGPNLLWALLGVPFRIELLTAQVLFHFSLASLFMYLLVRHLARRIGARLLAARFAGAVAALSFTYSGYLTSFPVQQLTILETAIWLPLVLFFLDRASDHCNPIPQLILAGMALACALLGGHPQTAIYVVYAALAYALFLVWYTRRAARGVHIGQAATPQHRSALRGVALVAVPFLVGLALAAVQLVPTLGFIARSTRADLTYEAVAGGFPLAEMTHLLYPGYFGGSPQYVGILPLILAGAALFVVRARRQVVFWIGLGMVALLLSFGGNTFFYSVTYLLAPGFATVRNQERIIYLFAFAVSVLAGYGALTLVQPLSRTVRKAFGRFVQGLAWVTTIFLALTALFYFGHLQAEQQDVEINLFEGVLRHQVMLLIILGGAAVLFSLRRSGRAKRSWLMAVALGLVWLNLFTINWRFNLAQPASGGSFPDTGLIAFLKEQPGTFRISSAGLLPGGPSAGIVYELEDVTGNTPLRLAAFQDFEERLGAWRKWQLLNVRYVLSRDDLDGPGLERVYHENGVKVYRIGDPLPRAWVVYGAVVVDPDQVIATLGGDGFDPLATAVLDDSGEAPVLPGNGLGTAAQILQSAPGKLVMDVAPRQDGLLVVSQPYYPGWQATVDGNRTPIRKVDYLLQGIPVTAGNHRVDLTFRPSAFPGLVSAGAVALCLAGLLLLRRRTPGLH